MIDITFAGVSQPNLYVRSAKPLTFNLLDTIVNASFKAKSKKDRGWDCVDLEEFTSQLVTPSM